MFDLFFTFKKNMYLLLCQLPSPLKLEVFTVEVVCLQNIMEKIMKI